MVIDLLAITACPILDRLRGGWLDNGLPSILWLVPYALALAWLADASFDHWSIWAWAALWTLGERPGWGAPIGQVRGVSDTDREPEGWQVSYLWDHPWLALVIRGAIWGSGGVMLAFWQQILPIVTLAIIMAFPLAEWLHIQWRPVEAANEWYRGGLVGVLTYIGGIVT